MLKRHSDASPGGEGVGGPRRGHGADFPGQHAQLSATRATQRNGQKQLEMQGSAQACKSVARLVRRSEKLQFIKSSIANPVVGPSGTALATPSTHGAAAQWTAEATANSWTTSSPRYPFRSSKQSREALALLYTGVYPEQIRGLE